MNENFPSNFTEFSEISKSKMRKNKKDDTKNIKIEQILKR